MIYLIKLMSVDLCKIGYTVNLEGKIRSLETYCPFEVEFAEVRSGERKHEFTMHEKLKRFFVRREWFRYTPEVLDVFIAHDLTPMPNPKEWRRDLDKDFRSTRRGERSGSPPRHILLAQDAKGRMESRPA